MTQALYRRYRPVTFAEVIGQDHVTTPLQNALDGKRAHHAYLFSGPRGCGKTSCARILARCLNCEQGPTATPCGVCQSCIDLGPGGAGSLDVIEIDAASHGGVDDARDLRERAFYAPAGSRYKVYIIDEAHMVSREGFNALLKLVEEPPEHVTFVFATTEPEKVIATIRSRTHHYPFRLVPPKELHAHLVRVCEQEKVSVDATVLSLVVRAGRGSVRDALSVLDQLLAGAGEEGLTYAGAAALLGYTDASLLDDTVDALAARDSAAVFQIVDRVVEGGHDPRRFADDLLERLRDLIIIDAVPDAAGNILGEHPADELERMRRQSANFGAAELTRAAEIVNAGLTEMRGATAPRLHLELICARVLLPGADDNEAGFAARLDRLERRSAIAAATGASSQPQAHDHRGGGERGDVNAAPGEPAESVSAETSSPAAKPRAHDRRGGAADPGQAARRKSQAVGGEGQAVGGEGQAAGGGGHGIDLITVRQMWPTVLDEVKGMRRHTWTLLSHNGQVAALEPDRLTLSLVNAGARDSFLSSGGDQIVHEALITVLGVDWKVDAIIDPSTSPAAPAGPAPTRIERPAPAADDHPSPHDDDADDSGVTGQDLLARELGAKVIGEYDAS